MKLRLILHGKAARDPRVRDAVDAVRSDGHVVEVRVTWESGDASRMARDAVEEARNGGLDVIVAGGGDGTVSEVFGASLAAKPPAGCSFGVLPLGTANDFAHSANIPVEDLTAALRLVTTTPARPIDVGTLEQRVFINLITGGFGSRVTVETDPDLKRRLGGLAYVVTGVSRFAELTANRGRFRAENFEWEGSFYALAIGNGRQAGGGISLCPKAMLDDGLLDLMILPEVPPDSRLDMFAQFVLQGAAAIESLQVTTRSPWIEYVSHEELYVNLDGEPVQSKRFRVECHPGALPVHLGQTDLVKQDNASA
ncbi:lipid kinase YegS [Kaistia dalseonensis]|uniref:Lipid kinase YegS n=1 Tax=Kaistia dalseonensis TaxID=410840 RepID=A0ABU0HBX0_9HYPH|nr:lipid kinase YegS [Kaistia dalseonensis]MCX5496395.1 lipid kinase YegS [Kaistia dalseonensis]MDQ0439016.1 lipid kinase YegS [Kaistia dalseonensis]